MIAALLAELGRLLPAGGRRRRVLLEAEDHLRCAVEAGVAAGLDPAAAEAAAVRDFGSPAPLARRVREQLGSRAAAASSQLGLALLGVLAAVSLLRFTELANDAGAPRWWPDEPLLSTISLLAIEVAVVAGAVTVVRLLRHRAAAMTGAVRGALLRGLLVAALAGAAAALGDGASALRHLDAVRSSPLALVVTGLGVLVLLLAVATAAAGVRGLRVAPAGDRAPHPVDDLAGLVVLGLGGLERRAPVAAARLRGAVERIAEAALRHPRLLTLVDLRRHPWRVCAAVATLAFALQTAGYVPRDGLAVALAGGLLQGVAVVVAFALLGPVLGLRARRGRRPA
ncbi:MAG: hypothetical protein QOG45_1082 [Chloroflexota bacterium]|nr:hypothetical protein [Chloroflexota bacterium]